jgi:uncharacterized membrane-anchored protein
VRILLALAMLVCWLAPAWADPSDLAVADIDKKFAKVRWQQPGQRRLPESHSTLTVPSGYVMAAGADAGLAEVLLGNASQQNLEAAMLNRANHFLFQHFDEGYVAIDDWAAIDANAMLDGIKAGTEKDNVVRRGAKLREVHVLGWMKQPYLDRANASVYWAINATEGDTPLVNIVVLRLARSGFEKITWSVEKADYEKSGDKTLDTILAGFVFDPGRRYADHVASDKVAEYGIAALVASFAGIKIAQAAMAGGFLLLLKKFGAIAVVAIGGLGLLLRRLLKKKSA